MVRPAKRASDGEEVPGAMRPYGSIFGAWWCAEVAVGMAFVFAVAHGFGLKRTSSV